MGIQINLLLLLYLPFVLLLHGCAEIHDNVIYVNADAASKGDGKSWATAYNNLQIALDSSSKGDEIWIAAGIYKPTRMIVGNEDRHKSFQLKNGVALFGGFAASESSRDQRDWQTNNTILSGDLAGDDDGFTNNAENCYHVLTGIGTDSTAVLDGFTVTAGNANFDVWPDDGGGGMNNHNGSPRISNCKFIGNASFADGGGMRNWGDSKPLIKNCTFTENSSGQEGGGMMNGPGSGSRVISCKFIENTAGEDGGGMYNNETVLTLIVNCTFIRNSVNLTGGGMYNVNHSKPFVTNCTFSENSAVKAGGAICNNNSNLTLTSCVLWNNSAPMDTEIHNMGDSQPIVSFCNITGGLIGKGNIDKDPLFADKELRLSVGSPCIDAGDNNAVPADILTDLDGNPRFVNDSVDMGAFEVK
jgi:predicted outer membrane repeat protein